MRLTNNKTFVMGLFRFFKYRYLVKNRKRHYASLALSLALAHASFGAVKYRSIGNGIADISLALNEDQKFVLDLQKAEDRKKMILKGKWSVEADSFVLKFKRSKRHVRDLFGSNSGFNKSVRVEDEKTIRFPLGKTGLTILGIYCLKELV